MNILVIGSGGREHALVWAFNKSTRVSKVYCANGNAGISEIAECVDISPNEINALVEFAKKNAIDLTFVGGESPLALGIVDEFERAGLKIVGASKAASRLESSKAFAKDFMYRHDIPTARYQVAETVDEALGFLMDGDFGGEDSPLVVKADGLAAGKGVVVCKNHREAKDAIRSIGSGELVEAVAAKKIVLEECLIGSELSILLFCDGENFVLMPPTRDHKRIGENDTGANTGGMGTITDFDLISQDDLQKVIEEIITPTLTGAKSEGFPFSGVLFLGLMLTESGVKVLEYNVRFGDPEAEAILVCLESDIVDVCDSILNQNLDSLSVEWKDGCSACVILASEGYPESPQKGDVISGIEIAAKNENVEIFHAGTKKNSAGDFVTNGGRVLAITATASNMPNALHRAYKAVYDIYWDGMHFRRDIGK
ncbi:MAG: phosphoribosylamine--glycine ligase [Pyrinomonadaceae bacterium]